MPHFPRAVLEAAGGWDAFNVTEDADLGVRLARLGYRVAMLDSRTLEEAPIAPGQWLGQRTRWMKGWLQTFGVHTRDQARLARQLGPLAAAGFHAYMGGLILSALVHPLVYALAIGHGVASLGQGQPTRAVVSMVEVVALANLAFGYLTAMALGALAARRRGYEFWRHAMLMPLYWLAISLAAYRAVFELRRAPFWWQKTEHGVSRVSEPAAHPIGGRADQPAR